MLNRGPRRDQVAIWVSPESIWVDPACFQRAFQPQGQAGCPALASLSRVSILEEGWARGGMRVPEDELSWEVAVLTDLSVMEFPWLWGVWLLIWALTLRIASYLVCTKSSNKSVVCVLTLMDFLAIVVEHSLLPLKGGLGALAEARKSGGQWEPFRGKGAGWSQGSGGWGPRESKGYWFPTGKLLSSQKVCCSCGANAGQTVPGSKRFLL